MKMTTQQIAADLKKILAEELFVEVPAAEMKDTDSLATDLGLDSVGQIELVSIIEERYGFKVDTQQAAAEIKTLGAAADYVCKHLQTMADQDQAEPKNVSTP